MEKTAKQFYSSSSLATKKLAADLAKEILSGKKTKTRAAVLSLAGNLGSGKTTFVQGFLKALGIKKRITSPSFIIMRIYKLKNLGFKTVYHIDCYRLRKIQDLLVLGLKEIIQDPKNMVLIEWPEIVKNILPRDSIWLKFKHGEKINQRIIRIFDYSNCSNQTDLN